MYTEKDLAKLRLDGATDSVEDNEEKSLRWLLEMDLSEPEEKLFAVSGVEYQDTELSAYEAEVAGRPLVRGNAASDDLSTYVHEEIVISSEHGSDIYSRKSDPDADEPAAKRRDEVMAIDFSRGREARDVPTGSRVDEGADILGLAGEDDIGEKFVSIKRIKPVSAAPKVKEEAAVRPIRNNEQPEQPEESVPGSGVVGSDTSEPVVADQEHQLPQPISLTGAPVLTQIADPETDAVANDSGNGAQQGNVLDYVATIPQSLDDEEFDSYLLRGGHLADSSFDPEDLVVQRSEGVIAVDPSTEFSIDYHEDFHAMEGSDGSSVSAIAGIITPVMEEISSAVRARLETLGLDTTAVVVDAKLGCDEASIRECYAQGYEPVSAICFELPQPLFSIDQASRDAIYVRLTHVVSNDNWNHLFTEDFIAVDGAAPESVSAASVIADEPQALAGGHLESARLADEISDGGFGEDIFGDDFADDFTAVLGNRDGEFPADIEAAFADLAQDQDVDGSGDFNAMEPTGYDRQETPATEGVSIEQAPVEAQFAAAPAADACVQQDGPVPVTEAEAEAEEIDLAAFDGTRVVSFIPDYIKFNYTSQSNAEIFTDFLDAFIEEGSAEVEKLENEVGEWEKNIGSETLFAKVSRTLHTIKGIAKGVGLQRLGTLVHNFETLLDKMPRPGEGEQQTYFRIVNAWLDAVVRGVEFVADQRMDVASEFPGHGGETAPAPEEVVEQQQPALAPPQAGSDTPRPRAKESIPAETKVTVASALEKKRDQQLADEGAKVLAAQQSVRITSEKLDHLLNLASQAQQLGVRASQTTSRSKRSSAELQARLSSVRTHIRKIADRALLNVNTRRGSSTPDLDALEMDQYSELQEAASILREGVEDLADLVDVVSRQNMQIEGLLKQQSSVISSISSSIQGARVVPVSRLMPGLRRIVRTVSTDLGKVVSFKVLNETGALDRDHYARLQIILEHMVRNALDHGIESPDERVAVGKPTGGRITVDVRKSGGDYVIRLSDDGRGIDPDAIRESAFKKDLDVDVDALSDEEAIRLIFHKGFSTASTLSEISGRGVGMDIVLTELQQIGGDIQIHSAVGLGTAFEVRIPSNVSVNGALLVATAGESYAIPLNGLIAVEQVTVDEFFAAVDSHTTLSLSDMDCEPAYLATLCQGLGLPDRSAWEKFVPVIIAGSPERYMAIAIDNLEEALELVVRSLGSQFSTVPGVAGAATTAEGEAIVALDLNLLVSSAGADGIAPSAVSQAKPTTLLALVVDDSRTQRMVATSQLDTVGVETVTAENGLVAIDLLNATHRLPDIILLDVEMPVKDGIQTLREIRKSRRYGHLPVIMVTSRTGAKHRALASEAGCNAYMGKPFNFPALIKQINDLTGHDLQLS
ncbi:MAG: response regulator [Halioglobus sp.]